VSEWEDIKLINLVVAYGDARQAMGETGQSSTRSTHADSAARALAEIRNHIGRPNNEQQDSAGRMFREITDSDVGKSHFAAFGRKWLVAGFMGYILSSDVGKRVYLVATDADDSLILQVESYEQRAARQAG
jgi:hypothetical protein